LVASTKKKWLLQPEKFGCHNEKLSLPQPKHCSNFGCYDKKQKKKKGFKKMTLQK